MKKVWHLKVLAIVTAFALLITVIQLPLFVSANNEEGTETIVAELVNRAEVSAPDSTKSNYFNRYYVPEKSTSYYSYNKDSSNGTSAIVKFGGNGIGDKNAAQTFLFNLNDATISFTPYFAGQTYAAKMSVYGSKDGEIWLPLVINEEPGNSARKGNNNEWNPDSDVTELGALNAWSNYNTDNMHALLNKNAEKKIYIKFCYVGDGVKDAEARAFGVTASYDVGNKVSLYSGVENYISSAGNRSNDAAYWPSDASENDSTKDTYFQKYMIVGDSSYRGLRNVAQFNSAYSVESGKNKIVFKYDLDDRTTTFTPIAWVNGNGVGKLKVEASKDGSNWFEILNEDINGDKVSGGLIYGDINNAAYIDATKANYCSSAKGKEWISLNSENIENILNDNNSKIVYLRFSRAGAAASGDDMQFNGFGITSKWNATAGTETIVAELVNRSEVTAPDANKSNYFNNYYVPEKSTGYHSYSIDSTNGASAIIKFGGNGISAINASQTFLFDLNNAATSFTPYFAGQTYTAKMSVYGSKDGEIWLPLVINEEPGNNARKGNDDEWNPDADITERGALTAWSNYNLANMNALLIGNTYKKVYIKFCYVGDGIKDAEARAFGVTAVYDVNSSISSERGVENFISDAGNRSDEGAYKLNNSDFGSAPQNDNTKETYFQKYMVIGDSYYRGFNEVAQFNSVKSDNKVVFKYDLDDNTVDITPIAWVNQNSVGKVKVEVSKDNTTWYEIINEDVSGDNIQGGIIYGDIDNAAYIDATRSNYCSSVKGRVWTTINRENINRVLWGNESKVVYVRFSRAGAAASGGDDMQFNGFGITGIWDKNATLTPPQTPSEPDSSEPDTPSYQYNGGTYVAEVVNREEVTSPDSDKHNYFNKYYVREKSTGYYSYSTDSSSGVSSIIKFGGNGISAINAAQTFLFDLKDDTTSFTPYFASQTYTAKMSVYGSKDGEIWLPLVLNDEPGSSARKGNNDEWNPHRDVVENGTLTAWSNYNTVNMKTLLSNNVEKKIYIKFCYVGDGSAEKSAEARAFGITSVSNTNVTADKGTEHYISSAGNRSEEGAYWNNTRYETDNTKETYFQKYMVIGESSYRGLNNVAQFNNAYDVNSGKNRIVFKYDLDDNTIDFTPVAWVNQNGVGKLKVEVSKDGTTWYEIINEDVNGDGISGGLVYGDLNNTAYIDAGNTGYIPSVKGKEWTSIDKENINRVLWKNESKVVYVRFSRAGAAASGGDDMQFNGFGITGIWDNNATLMPPVVYEYNTETFVAEVVNRDGVANVDSKRENYFNKNFVAEQSTRFVNIFNSDWVVKMGGAYTDGLNGSYVFKYNLNDSTVSFTPHIATVDYTAKLNVYASKDGATWLPLIENEALMSKTYYGDSISFFPNKDVESKGIITSWENYNYVNASAVLADNPTKIVYLKFDYIGTGEDEAQVRAFGISSVWDEDAEDAVATSGIENFISNTANRDNYAGVNPNKKNYFQKYLVSDATNFYPLNYLLKLYTKKHQVVFKYDLNDATSVFTPYLWGSGDCDAFVTIEASNDGVNWLKIVDNEHVVKGHYGDSLNTSHTFATGVKAGVNDWSTLNAQNIAEVLKENPEKIVYLKYTYSGDYNSKNEAVSECQLQGFGITGVWDKTGYETFVGEAENRDDVSGCGYQTTDSILRSKHNYFNKYIVVEQSAYTSLSPTLIKLGGTNTENGYITFKYDLNDATTAFYPYLYTAGNYTAKISILASSDGVNWLSIVEKERLYKGEFVGNSESFKPHDDIVNKGELRNWKNFNMGNMRLVLSNNPTKTVYLKFIYVGSGKDEAQISALGITSTFDANPEIEVDPSVPVGSTNVVIREEILAATNNRDGYDGTNPDADDYFDKYVIKDKSSYTGLYHLVKLVKGDKVVVKFNLNDLTTEFTPWLLVGGDKYSTVKVNGSKDGNSWLELCEKADAIPGASLGKDTPWPNFNSKNMRKLLEGNSDKVIYLSFEFIGGAYNPVNKINDEEAQPQGFGIIGEHKAKALSASVTEVAKTEYAISDEELDINDSEITVKYDTGEVISYPLSVADVRGFKAGVSGEQTIFVEMHGIVATYKIKVDSMPIKSVKITKLPNILEFEIGEALNVKGGKVMVTFDDDTTDERNLVRSMVVGFNSSKINDKLMLTVIVGDASTEYYVRIIEKTRFETDDIRIDATPFVTPDGILEMISPEDQEEDHKKLLAERKKNGCEDDLNLGALIKDSALSITTPTNNVGVVMNVFAGGHFTFEMDLDNRAVDFELTRGWGTYRNMKILASKDGGKSWYLIGRVLEEVSGKDTVFTSSDLTQEDIDKNVEWILTGNPEKKFLVKYVADSYGSVEGNIQINNIMMNVKYVVGPRYHKDLPTVVPEGYKIPKAYTFGMLKSEQGINEEDEGEIILPEDSETSPDTEDPEVETPAVDENPTVEKKINLVSVMIYIICSVVIVGSWSLISVMFVKLRKKRKA